MAQETAGGGMKLTEFLKLEVVSTDGRHLGRVVELRCEGEPEHGDIHHDRIVSELVFGKAGWLERIGFRAVNEQSVPWKRILTIGDGKIVISNRTEAD